MQAEIHSAQQNPILPSVRPHCQNLMPSAPRPSRTERREPLEKEGDFSGLISSVSFRQTSFELPLLVLLIPTNSGTLGPASFPNGCDVLQHLLFLLRSFSSPRDLPRNEESVPLPSVFSAKKSSRASCRAESGASIHFLGIPFYPSSQIEKKEGGLLKQTSFLFLHRTVH